MSKYIDLRLFLISLAIGILLVYLYQPTPTVIYVYPTPDNVDKLLKVMKNVQNNKRGAKFRTSMVFVDKNMKLCLQKINREMSRMDRWNGVFLHLYGTPLYEV